MKTRGSWVASANHPESEFPIENLPFGRFMPTGLDQADPRLGVAIGDQILDLGALVRAIPIPADESAAFAPLAAGDLNAFMALHKKYHQQVRARLTAILSKNGQGDAARVQGCLVPQSQARMVMPCTVGDYTDFYTSIHHATSVGSLFRPDNPLLPNYKWVPIGYHGRSSTLQVSGGDIPRPSGQIKPAEGPPVFGPCQKLDFELEVGFFLGAGNAPGVPIPIAEAEDHFFGLCLLNDWSARDIQSWEYQPLGPFLSKNFATTLSPWIVTREALAPFRVPYTRPVDDPAPLPYLTDPENQQAGGIDLHLQISIQSAEMRARNLSPHVLAKTNLKYSFWTMAQLITHHSSNGCLMRSGDLLGSGTMSGPDSSEAGSLLELTRGGKEALTLPSGETRRFIEDGDAIEITGFCQNASATRIGLGSCRAVIGST
ncbi:MAG: fumarylacetoacetase [Betaproteobacteria bacterium]|jgi:fumarylacetoacetase|nr:fumarylacetoacetase [Betaproteobacteria bacterium]